MSRVYVGNLSSRATERDIEGFFRGFGKIRDVMLKNGFGFVEFDDARDAEDAVYEQNGRELCGERVVVEISRRERPNDDGGKDGGYYGGRDGGYQGGRDGGYQGGRDGGYHGGRDGGGYHGGRDGGGYHGGRDGGYHGGGGRGYRSRGGYGSRGGYRGGGALHRFSARYGPPIQTRYRMLIYNLSTRCSWQDLKDLMRNAGEVTYADAHKKTRNEAVVCFASHDDLRRALDRYQGKDINGRRIKLVDDSDSYGGGGRRSRSRTRSRSAYRSRSRSPPSRSPSPAENGRSRSRTRSRSRSLSSASRKSGSQAP